MTVYALDYGGDGKGKIRLYDGVTIYRPNTLKEVVDLIPPGSVLWAEASLCSYGVNDALPKFLEACAKKDIHVVKLSNRAAKNHHADNKKEYGDVTDDDDVVAIWDIARLSTYHPGKHEVRPYSLRVSEAEAAEYQHDESLKREIRLARSQKYRDEYKWLAANGFPQKAAPAQTVVLARFLLRNGVTDRDTFEKYTGTYALAKPFLVRASWHRDYLRAMCRQAAKARGASEEEIKNAPSDKTLRKQCLKEMRKLTRNIFSRAKQVGTLGPEPTGTVNPTT